MRRRLAACGLVVLAALAGCSGAGGVPDTPTLTPAPIPGDTPRTGADAGLAPGTTGRGVEHPFLLVEAHAAVLENASYTVRINRTVVRGGTRTTETLVSRFAAGKTRYYQVFVRSRRGPDGSQVDHWEFYADGERLLEAIAANDTKRYYVPRSTVGEYAYPHRVFGSPTRRNELYAVLKSMDTTVAGRLTRDGTTLYRVVATGLEHPELLAAREYVDAIRSASFVALVAPDGVVREYRLEYRGVKGGDPIHVVETARYTNVGSTEVADPPWYDDALENVTTIEDERGADAGG